MDNDHFDKSIILYADGGFTPAIPNNKLTIGPEQLVVIGFGKYSAQKYLLGRDETIRIPVAIDKLETGFKTNGRNSITTTVNVPAHKNIRILFQQFSADGFPYRTWGGGPPDGKTMDTYFQIKVTQDNKTIPLHIMYDKMIWSGLSWAAGEVQHDNINANEPITIECISLEKENLSLQAAVYATVYE